MNKVEERRAIARHTKKDSLLQRFRLCGHIANENPGGGFRIIGPNVNAYVLTFAGLENILQSLETNQEQHEPTKR